jgi:hypothetical protein
MKMMIKSIKFNSRKENVYDIETSTHDYVLSNGIISHNTQELYSKPIVSGGTGVYLSADTIFILGRQQEKEGTDIVGYNFIVNVEKSRHVREKSKIPISVKFDGGLSTWSGLIEMALESGHVIKPSNGWYSKVDGSTGVVEEKKYRMKDTDNKDFWLPVLSDKTFQEWIKTRYQISTGNMMTSDEDISKELDAIEDDDIESELDQIEA